MATYVNDLRLKEIGTGESSGTWGTETNVNLELIGEALGYGTEGITTNADTHTTTVADGSTDPGRAMYIEYTGTLDSACTVTIAPNTLSRLHYIENGTSGSQNIIIKQGSGATVTIPPGDTKAVYLDGAGSGAKVVDVFASFSVVDLKVQDDLTVTDDATVGGTLGVTGILTCTDDIIIGDGKTIGSASDVDAMTIAANGQVTFTQTLIGTALDISGDIDVDGTANLDIVDIDGATNIAAAVTMATNNKIQFRDDAIHISSTADGQLDLVADTEIQIAATTIDINGAINASGEIIAASLDISGNIDVDGTTNLDVVDIDGAVDMASTLQVDGVITTSDGMVITTADNTDTLTLISTDADAAVGPVLNLYRNSSSPADNDLVGQIKVVARNDNSQDVEVFRIDNYIADVSDGTEDSVHSMYQMRGGTMRETLSFGSTELVINDASTDYNFRVESDSNANALIVDAGLSHVGINRAANSVVGLSINSTATNSSTFGLEVCNSSSNTKFIVRSDGFGGFYKTGNGAGFLHNTDGGITTTPDAGGHFVINEDSVDADFRVESNVNANSFYLDGATGVIGLGFANTTAANQLHILGTSGVPSVNMSLQTNDTANARAGITLMSRKADNTNVSATLINHTTSLQSSLGISFGSDTAAANALDDYEEGTWTPDVSGSSSTSGVGYAVQEGNYTKVGNMVTANFSISFNDKGSMSGTTRITGLPFSGNNGPQQQSCSLQTANMNIDADQQVVAIQYAVNALAYLYIQEPQRPLTQISGNNQYTDTSQFIGSLTYFTNS